MPIDLTVPPWVTETCNFWMVRLRMLEWRVEVGMSLAPDGRVEVVGLATPDPDLNFGRITLRADIEEDIEGESYIVHELLHIKHSRIDEVVMKVLEPHIGDVPTELTNSLYRSVVEPFVYSMARSLVEGRRLEVQEVKEDKGGK